MDTIAISEFRARCLAELERVQTTGEPLLVTNGGVPVAQIIPASDPEVGSRSMRTVELDWDDLQAANWSWTPPTAAILEDRGR